MASTSPVTIEEARATGRYTELKSAGVTYTYTKRGSWIDGHEWASPRELEERTENGGRKDATKSWLVAQCLWWGLREPGHRLARYDTKPVLNELLYQHIMAGCFASIHPKPVWDTLKGEWKDKFGDSDSDDEDSRRPRFEYIEMPSGGGAFLLDLTKPQ